MGLGRHSQVENTPQRPSNILTGRSPLSRRVSVSLSFNVPSFSGVHEVVRSAFERYRNSTRVTAFSEVAHGAAASSRPSSQYSSPSSLSGEESRTAARSRQSSSSSSAGLHGAAGKAVVSRRSPSPFPSSPSLSRVGGRPAAGSSPSSFASSSRQSSSHFQPTRQQSTLGDFTLQNLRRRRKNRDLSCCPLFQSLSLSSQRKKERYLKEE